MTDFGRKAAITCWPKKRGRKIVGPSIHPEGQTPGPSSIVTYAARDQSTFSLAAPASAAAINVSLARCA